jgi:sensor histidine kinase YesM
MEGAKQMEYLLSLLYTFAECFSFVLLWDGFSTRRWQRKTFWLAFALWYMATYSILNIQSFIFPSGVVHIFVSLALYLAGSYLLYRVKNKLYFSILCLLGYLILYGVSFGCGMLGATICGMTGEEFRATKLPLTITTILTYLMVFMVVLVIRQLPRTGSQMHLKKSQLFLSFIFPASSLLFLITLLLITTDHSLSTRFVAFCLFLILASNMVILLLLNWMAQTTQSREQELALTQTIKYQSENMEALGAAYADQRKLTHDFYTHLELLNGLLSAGNMEDAVAYLQTLRAQQTTRALLVNSHHAVLDALLNQKAYTARQHGIDISFEVNDLSGLPFEPADMIVILANLLDNAIEACDRYAGKKRIEVKVLLGSTFFFSVRNTCDPVKITNNEIQTTKPNPAMHGFGLKNVKTLLQKYQGDSVMLYENSWFQFTGEIAVPPHS